MGDKERTPEVLDQKTEKAIEDAVVKARGKLTGMTSQLEEEGSKLAGQIAQQIKEQEESS